MAKRAAPGRGVKEDRRGQVFAWGVWDWGSASFNAVVTTFVFSVYLTKAVGDDLPGSISASSWLGWSLGAAGFIIAILAPVTGQRTDTRGRRRPLALLTGAVVACMALMYFVRDDHRYLWLGLALLAVGSVLFELAGVPYNAMLHQISTRETLGRVSAFGWAMGYFGGIVLLLICYFGFISGDGPGHGFLGVSSDDGWNIRLVVLLCALWFAVAALPVLFAVPDPPRLAEKARRESFLASYRRLLRDIAELWRTDRPIVTFLIASAVFRDGLTGVFTFGAVLAVNAYGISESDVLLFGVAANVVSAIGALTAGRVDDRLGPRFVIIVSLVSLVVTSLILLVIDGPLLFWVFGLVLCLFVGPAQSSARTMLVRMTPPGREGQLFGLYATTGRAVSFLAPTLFGLFVWLFDAERAGIIGIVLVLTAGLGLLLRVPAPRRPSTRPE